jgi:hypothetical protein
VLDRAFCSGFGQRAGAERGISDGQDVEDVWRIAERKHHIWWRAKNMVLFQLYFLGNEIRFWGIKCSTLQLKRFLRGEDDFKVCALWMSADGFGGFGFGAGELL